LSAAPGARYGPGPPEKLGYLRRARALAAAPLAHLARESYAGEPACLVATFFRDLQQHGESRPIAVT
jgi:hypothetical protein